MFETMYYVYLIYATIKWHNKSILFYQYTRTEAKYSLFRQTKGTILLAGRIEVVHAEALQESPHVDEVEEGLKGDVCRNIKCIRLISQNINKKFLLTSTFLDLLFTCYFEDR